MKYRLNFKTLLISLVAWPAVGLAQGYENIGASSYISPSFFYKLLQTDTLANSESTYRFSAVNASAGIVSNYQYRNSYTGNSYLASIVSLSHYRGDIQLGANLMHFQPLDRKQGTISKGTVQFAYYLFADKFYSGGLTSSVSGSSGRPMEPPRLLIYYGFESHQDSTTFHELGLEYSIAMREDKEKFPEFLKSLQGGYIFSWRLNVRDFYYGIAYLYEFKIPNETLDPIGLGFGITRDKIKGTGKWANAKVSLSMNLNFKKNSSAKVYYGWARNFRGKSSNHEIGVMFNVPPFSALSFMSGNLSGTSRRFE